MFIEITRLVEGQGRFQLEIDTEEIVGIVDSQNLGLVTDFCRRM
jgi:hypothetical protein